jgi:hypothetical protein
VESIGGLPVRPINTYIVTITNTERCAVRECDLGSGSSFPCIVGIWISGGDQIEIRKNQVSDVISGVSATNVSNLEVVENGFAGPTTSVTTGGPSISGGMTGVDIPSPAGGIVSVESNEIVDFSQGVVVQVSGAAASATALPLQLTIGRNLVVRQGLASGSATDFGWTEALGVLLQAKAFGIFTDVPNASVTGNTIILADPGHGGILVAGSGIGVCGNTISSSVVPQQPTFDWPILPVGIVAYKPPTTASVDRCRIAENILSGPLKAIAVLAEEYDVISSPAISGNRVNNSGVNLAGEGIDLSQKGLALTLLSALITSLTSLGNAFGILMINTDAATLARNVVSTCTAGIAAIIRSFYKDETFAPQVQDSIPNSITLDGNRVDSSTVGILLGSTADPVVQNGMMVNNQVAISLYSTSDAVIVGNRCLGNTAVVHCLVLYGAGNRFEGNSIFGGATGLLASSTTGVLFVRNTVEDTAGTGIVAAWCLGEICLEGNLITECGSSGQSQIEEDLVGKVPGFATNAGWQLDSPVSSGIAVLNCSGVITVDGCAVIDTVQTAGSWCADIIVAGGAHVRVRNCRVVRSADGATHSRALLLYPAIDDYDSTRASADAGGNHIDVTNNSSSDGDFVAVDIECPTTGSDIIFVGNMILQRIGTGKNYWVVELTAESLAITGNRILREMKNEQYSLAITYTLGLSYVGNVVTRGAKITSSTSSTSSSVEEPAHPARFNAYVYP